MATVLGLAKDISQFYDNDRVDEAWRWYRINQLIHAPFSIMPSWREVIDLIDELRTQPTEFAKYAGIREHHNVNRGGWRDVDHVCSFILTLLYARGKYEKDEDEKKRGGNGNMKAGNMPTNSDTLARTYMLCQYRNEYAEDFLEKYPMNYLNQYRVAERNGGVNPIVAPPQGLTPEGYSHKLNKRSTFLFAKLWSYFKAIA